MDNTQIPNHNLGRIGWGLLAILWGATILFDFISFGAGLVGTGLILLGINMVRLINHLSPKADNAILGILLLAWGGLDIARPLLHQLLPGTDLNWVIFAILLIGFGLILLARPIFSSHNAQFGSFLPNEGRKDHAS